MRSLAAFLCALTLLAGQGVMAADEAPPQALSQPMPITPQAQPSEETPGFQAIRPLTPPAESAPAAVAPTPAPAPISVPVPPPAPMPAAQPPAASPPVAEAAAAVSPSAPAPAWLDGGMMMMTLTTGLITAVLIVVGALIAGLVGMGMVNAMYARDTARRRRAITANLAIELETRRQAFDAVPVPPNAEAGISFVSAVTALAELDYAWRSSQDGLHLLPEKLGGHLSVHYSAVRHSANFIKGQSYAAALRMLQANRIGGHPCPDAGTMREVHVELAAAFRGVDKILQGLKSIG